MGQIALGSLWGWVKYILLGTVVVLDIKQTIVLDYKDDDWQMMLSVIFRFSISFLAIYKTATKLETYYFDRKEKLIAQRMKAAELKKIELENKILEQQLKDKL